MQILSQQVKLNRVKDLQSFWHSVSEQRELEIGIHVSFTAITFPSKASTTKAEKYQLLRAMEKQEEASNIENVRQIKLIGLEIAAPRR